MVFSALEQTGKLPFDTVLFHGLVRDDKGRKMSKSLGNGIDPLEVIDKYGADALRFTLITGNAPGNDMRFYWERIEASRNFANKFWNASRFIMMNDYPEGTTKESIESGLTATDRWIISKVNTLVRDVTENMEKYELGIAASKIYDFIWEEFCDWYIELVKPRLWSETDPTKAAAIYTLKSVLTTALKLLHPYMPFVTEEIYCTLKENSIDVDDFDADSIMISEWPVYSDSQNYAADEASVDKLKEAVKSIRNIRAEMNVPNSRKAKITVVSAKDDVRELFAKLENEFRHLAFASEIEVAADNVSTGDKDVSVVIHDAVLYMPFSDLVDIEKEKERLNKEIERLTKEIARGEGMLSNERFLSKAPESKVEEEKAKLKKYTETLEQVKERLASL